VRGKSFALVEAVFLGSEDEGRELLEPLRKLGAVMDTFAMVPPAAIAELHMDPKDPVPGTSHHTLVSGLDAAGLDEFLAVTGPGSGSPLLSVEFRQLGGALAQSDPSHGAIDTLDADYAYFGVGIAATPEITAATEAHLEKVADVLAPYEAGLYANFTESRAGVDSFFGGETVERLRAVKADVDPNNLFQANYTID
jgi:FAD/FMN-containing dehydrogenase